MDNRHPARGSFNWSATLARRFLELGVGLLPLLAIAYLYAFMDPALRFEDHLFHELAIGIAILESGFIAYVSWRCYQHSGEPFVRWLTLGFIGFTLIYSLHGMFTPVAHHNMALFILYGPTSRLTMSACLFMALLSYGRTPDAGEIRDRPGFWLGWVGFFLLINGAVALLATSPLADSAWPRIAQEVTSIALCLLSLLGLFRKKLRSPLMGYYALSLAWIAFSSLSFTLSRPWNHQWWLAHGIFAVGFSILAYGVLRAFLSSGSFERVFSSQELSEDLASTNIRLQQSRDELEQSNRRLEAQVQASESTRAQFESLFQLSPDGIIIVEGNGRIRKANPAAETAFSYPPGGLQGRQIEELMPEEQRARHVRSRNLYQYSPVVRPMGALNQALACVRQDGSVFPAAISLSSLVFEGQTCIVTFIRDLSGLREMDEQQHLTDLEIRRHETMLEEVVQQFPGLVFRFRRRPDGRYEFDYASGKSREVLGVAPDELLRDSRLWFARVRSADLPGLITALEQSASDRTPWRATWRMGADEVSNCILRTAHPVLEKDGSLLWTGHMRLTEERAGDKKWPRSDDTVAPL